MTEIATHWSVNNVDLTLILHSLHGLMSLRDMLVIAIAST